jgi:WhiB family redox-sensing transcriptional regulator
MTAQIGMRTERVRRLLVELGFTGAAVRDCRERAACVGRDPELFYPVGAGPQVGEQIAAAKAVCAGCPVRELCLGDAMASEDPASRWGVTGGLSATERTRLFDTRRREQRRAVA